METPPKRPRKNAPGLPWIEAAPKGMWYELREGGDQPFVARWRLPGGAKDSAKFSSARERAEFAGVWLSRRAAFGRAALTVSPREAEALAEFRRITDGADLVTVARDWVRWRGVAEGRLPLDRAIRDYKTALAGRALAKDSVGHRDLHLRRFGEAFAGRSLAEVTGEGVAAWLTGLRDPASGEPMGGKTRLSHRATVNRFFVHAVAARWVDRNPCDAVPVPVVDESESVNIFTVEQAAHLFAVNRGALCIGRLALEAFGGLRFSSAARLRGEDIAREERGVVLPGPKHKSGRRHYVEGWPDNLWAWIEHAPEAGWEISARMYLDHKRRAFERAGLKGEGADAEAMRNVLRHSFATYHVAMLRDVKLTALLLTHRNPAMLWQHYRGRATQPQGKAYFEIVP